MTSKISSTLHQINELLLPTPELGSDTDIDSDTQAKLVEYDDVGVEVEPRRSNLAVISSFNDNPRYTGKKVSRKSVDISDRFSDDVSKADEKVKVSRIYNDSERISGSSSDSDISVDGRLSITRNENVPSEDDSSGSEEEEEKVSDEVDDSDEEDDNGVDVSTLGRNGEESPSTDFQHLSSSTDLRSEIEKANAVRNQLSLWDKFVECRINLQKCVNLANRFPQNSTIEAFKQKGGESFSLEMKKTEKGVTNLLEKLLEIQDILISSYSETSGLGHSSSVNCEDEEIESDDCENSCVTKDSTNLVEKLPRKRKHVDDFENDLSSIHNQYIEFRSATIQKWNDRTRVSFGKAKRSDFSSFEQTTVQQIQFVLSNRSRLIQRTRHRSAVNSILGEQTEGDTIEKEFDSEIFDDSDFYHQILKELIERHSDGTHDATTLGRRWAEIQKLRTKMKRKIDTRATKGRKLRYTPHQKLVGLMAPVNLPSNWDDRATTELFNSLFGKKL